MSDMRKLLVVDDDNEVREVVAEYFSRHGWQVFEATNGLEALLHVKHEPPHAVLLDLRMPRLGGLETLKRIRAFNPRIAVVIVSGNLDPGVRRQAETLGAAAILDKPLDLGQLRHALATATPTQTPAVTTSANEAAAPAIVVAPSTSRTILIADDDADLRGMLEEFLHTKGYRTRSAADGAAAVRELVAAPADVVLLDIDMPELRGIDALPTLRAVAPRAAIIMISGTTNEETAKRTLAAGAFDYITKPIDLVHLVDTIETATAMQAVHP